MEKYVEEPPAPSASEIIKRTLNSLNKLGNQTFALSPFSQYFDDWLVNLRQVIAGFESSPEIGINETFAKECTQILNDLESALAERRLKEFSMEKSAKTLSENNHLLVETDADYAAKTRELGAKRNAEVERLTRNVTNLEEQLEATNQTKAGHFNFFAKKAKAQKEAEAAQKLNAAKKELELAIQNYKIEQDKLHDDYEKRKQALMEKTQTLEKEIAEIEMDGSLIARQAACNRLADAVKALQQS